MKSAPLFVLFLVFQAVCHSLGAGSASAQSLTIVSAPTSVTIGQTVSVQANYSLATAGILQVQFFKNTGSGWQLVNNNHINVSASGGLLKSVPVSIPTYATTGGNYLWQVILYDSNWVKKKEKFVYNVTVGSGGSSEWTPPGNWTLDWNDEFEGTGEPTEWYPLLGYNPDEFANYSEFGIRHTDPNPVFTDPESAWMYSTKYSNNMPDGKGTYWLDGSGHLVMRAVSEKNDVVNAGWPSDGPKANCAYLLSGYPDVWDSTEPNNVKWGGKFVSPASGPIYISTRVKTNQVVGYSTWFAFWLFTETRAYNDVPSNGTEVDVIEIPKGANITNAFNVANHWKSSGGSNSKQFNTLSTPTSGSFVNVDDSDWHVYGVEWTTTSMKCYVDGQLYYTFTDHIPSNPVDMMMLLTLEYQLNAWQSGQDDGKFVGPYVSNTSTMREMSRVLVDYVHIHKKQ